MKLGVYVFFFIYFRHFSPKARPLNISLMFHLVLSLYSSGIIDLISSISREKKVWQMRESRRLRFSPNKKKINDNIVAYLVYGGRKFLDRKTRFVGSPNDTIGFGPAL